MQEKFSFLWGRFENLLYGCQPSPVATPPAEHSYLDNPLMFFKQAPSKVCIFIFFSVAFVFAPHLYFGGGEEKGLYLCLCGDHWPLAFSLKAAFSFSEGSTSFATDCKFAQHQVQIQKSLRFATFVSQLRRGIKNTDILRSG